jgi:hypothetical protein
MGYIGLPVLKTGWATGPVPPQGVESRVCWFGTVCTPERRGPRRLLIALGRQGEPKAGGVATEPAAAKSSREDDEPLVLAGGIVQPFRPANQPTALQCKDDVRVAAGRSETRSDTA